VVASALMNAGMEVVYTGLRQTPSQIVASAIQEDVDVIAMSILSGAHDYLFPKVMELLGEKGVTDMLVVGGGIIPDEDIPSLKAAGIAEIFGPGTTTTEIIDYIRANVKTRN
jgi:methylmalonyl-CoA mutase C-terminal domain/subunit